MAQPAFDSAYARLPDHFFARVTPTPVKAPRMIRVNAPLATELGIDPDWLASEEGVAVLAGNRVPDTATPIATAYAGHQFGGFVPQLGDGRAILLGEVIDRGGTRRDVQLKGAGPTPYSRRGDGRAALGPVLREYLVSEAMQALGIPTTRALAAVTTGERVIRETMLPGAVLARVASSHIRVGTFQFFASRGDVEGVRIARWLLVGFVHGVMNTDNTSVAGETIDYGPCAFLDEYDPQAVFSSIDLYRRYAYGNQPAIAQWNLTRLAECLLPLLGDDADAAAEDAVQALEAFGPAFERAYQGGLRRKLGLSTEGPGDAALAEELLQAMAANGADFTLTFRGLSEAAADEAGDAQVRSLFADPGAYDAWAPRWRQRLAEEPGDAAAHREAMLAVNPAFIPRNHRIEAVIRAAVDRDDFAPFEELLTVLARPFDTQPEFARYMEPPARHERVTQTFCGT
jgi:uncharacterized protein YdiU (UPF0061 family)